MNDSQRKWPDPAAFKRIGLLIAGGAGSAGLTFLAGFDFHQALSSSIFIIFIMATLLFWRYRLAIAFIGIAILLGSGILTLRTFVESCELDIILFLVGMMVVVGVLKELGLFTWIIQSVLNMKGMNGRRFVLIIILLSAFMACAVGDVPSMVFMCALIFQVCDTLKIKPFPFLIISVAATNIGSAGTILGNPVGILLGHKGGFMFTDFLLWSFPIMLPALGAAAAVLFLWYRPEIRQLSERLEARRRRGLELSPLVRIPFKRPLLILICVLTLIALHNVIEQILGIQHNTILIAAPLFISGILMMWRPSRARHYIENEVEWWTLLFFMMLFAVAGSLAHTGVTARLAGMFMDIFGTSVSVLMPIILVLSAAGSALLNNLVLTAAFIPVVTELGETPLWWALLLGACFGGNITLIASAANIIALGMAEKRYRAQVRFVEWLKVGVTVGLVSTAAAWVGLLLLSPYMPERTSEPEKKPAAVISRSESLRVHSPPARDQGKCACAGCGV